MENVPLNQKEQARLQILNSLLSEHMTLDQAAILMGVSTRHTRRILAAYRQEGAAALAHGIGVEGLPTQHPIRQGPKYCVWLEPRTQESTTLI